VGFSSSSKTIWIEDKVSYVSTGGGADARNAGRQNFARNCSYFRLILYWKIDINRFIGFN
jgi:hypothetical protein